MGETVLTHWGKSTQPKVLGVGLLPALLLFCFPALARSEEITLLDLDKTVLNSSLEAGGTFITCYKLFKIAYRGTMAQPAPEGPDVVEVQEKDFERITENGWLGKGNYEPGAIGKQLELAPCGARKTALTLNIGEYMIREPDTFERFGPGVEGDNFLLEDFKAAYTRDPAQNWRGPFWELFVLRMSNEETASRTGFLTARFHTVEQVMEWCRFLQSKGLIKYLPNPKLIHLVGDASYDRFYLHRDIAPRKAAVLEETIKYLARQPLDPVKDLRLHWDGKRRTPLHSVTVADDSQDNVNAIYELFRQYAGRRIAPIKFNLFNAGNQRELRVSDVPRFGVLREVSGSIRQAFLEERLGEPRVYSKEQLAWLKAQARGRGGKVSCETILKTGLASGVSEP